MVRPRPLIVVDSSVWIAELRNQNVLSVLKLRQLVASNPAIVLIGDVVLLEVLQGARDDRHAEGIAERLSQFPIASMLSAGLAVKAASNYRLLRQKGVTIRKTADLIIGTYCLERGHQLLHNDRDFDPMVTHLGLQAA